VQNPLPVAPDMAVALSFSCHRHSHA